MTDEIAQQALAMNAHPQQDRLNEIWRDHIMHQKTTPLQFTPEVVVRLLRQTPLPVSTEAAMQEAVEQRMKDFLMPFEREVHMGPNNRIDFMVEGGIGIEVKTRCPRRQIHRQLARYADHPDVTALILVTGTFTGLPETLNEKPVFLVSSGRASL